MIKIRTYLLLAMLFMGMTSCLDKYPSDMVQSDRAITTVQEADQAVIGIYSAFLSNALYSGHLTLLPDIQSDLAYAVNGYSNTFGDVWRWEILATNSQIEAVYASLYEVITRCNFLLDNIERVRQNTTEDEDLDRIDQYCGEAYFARALAYSELIKCFCKAYEPETAANELGVVLREHYNSDEPVKRASLYDSYQFVLDDLDRAANCLKLEEDFNANLWGSTYFNEYTIYALRARVALYMQDWKAAKKYASRVIGDSSEKDYQKKYYQLSNGNAMASSTMNELQYLWADDEGFEIIWKIGYTINNYGGSLGTIFFNYDYMTFKPDYVPATWVLNLYDANDLRLPAYFVEKTTGYSHHLTWPLLAKYFGNEQFIANQILHTCMPKVFRLAEQYLIRAEASAQLNDFGQASKDITTLRKSRYTSGYSTTLTADNWLEVIEEERVKELYMEGFRLQDLKRWHKGFERKPQQETLINGNSLKIEKDHPLFVWPIPKHELESPGSQIEPNESNK